MTAHEVIINENGTEMVITDASKEMLFLHLEYISDKLRISIVEEENGQEKEVQMELCTKQSINALQLYFAKVNAQMPSRSDRNITSFGTL
ncbi:MAG: hypothetical protein J6C92_02725 [Bacteroidaceae bacterium]|nr:hypothetical protein [Bacteroidaceae bacterium]